MITIYLLPGVNFDSSLCLFECYTNNYPKIIIELCHSAALLYDSLGVQLWLCDLQRIQLCFRRLSLGTLIARYKQHLVPALGSKFSDDIGLEFRYKPYGRDQFEWKQQVRYPSYGWNCLTENKLANLFLLEGGGGGERERLLAPLQFPRLIFIFTPVSGHNAPSFTALSNRCSVF